MNPINFSDELYVWQADATAGESLLTGERWWGTRIRYRPVGGRRWRAFTAVDVHPFDDETVELALRARLANERADQARDAHRNAPKVFTR